MKFVVSTTKKPVMLRLGRDLVRVIKRGNPWVFADALRDLPLTRPGAIAILLDNRKGREIARGFYDPHSPLALRICTPESNQPLDDTWAETQFKQALTWRQTLFNHKETTGFRLFNGEGDGLPGLVCDIYGQTGVIRLDGPGPSYFWQAEGIAAWVAEQLHLETVYLREERRTQQGSPQGRVLYGPPPAETTPFVEKGVHFTTDVQAGQKTGFFLDQRENRQHIRHIADGKDVLNVCGYTGGFSVYAGLGGAQNVTTVDLAAPALEMAHIHWQKNGLPSARHHSKVADAFQFLEEAARKKQSWDLVIVDPPSFVSAKSMLKKGRLAYEKLIAASVKVTAPGGIVAAASCSSHVDQSLFLEICETAISKAYRRGTVLAIYGQPADHPSPLALPEFRYLKFVLLKIT